MQRRTLITGGSAALALLAAPAVLRAQALEKKQAKIAVGGKNLLYYLPLTVAEQRGYFKDEGLDLEIVRTGERPQQAIEDAAEQPGPELHG